MDNLSKAINMGVNAILFVVAVSIAITSYVNIMTFLDNILQTSDRHTHDIENQVLDSAWSLSINSNEYYL